MNTITSGDFTTTPVAIDGLEFSSQSGNVVHEILGSPEPDVTFGPAMQPTGTLNLVYATFLDARNSERGHRAGEVFTLVTGLASFSFSYVVSGAVRLRLPYSGSAFHRVSVEYQEVTP